MLYFENIVNFVHTELGQQNFTYWDFSEKFLRYADYYAPYCFVNKWRYLVHNRFPIFVQEGVHFVS